MNLLLGGGMKVYPPSETYVVVPPVKACRTVRQHLSCNLANLTSFTHNKVPKLIHHKNSLTWPFFMKWANNAFIMHPLWILKVSLLMRLFLHVIIISHAKTKHEIFHVYITEVCCHEILSSDSSESY